MLLSPVAAGLVVSAPTSTSLSSSWSALHDQACVRPKAGFQARRPLLAALRVGGQAAGRARGGPS